MKGIDLFCASPASTAVSNQRSDMGRRRRGHRPIDDRGVSSNKLYHPPCSSHLPILPQPTCNYKFQHEKSRKSTDHADNLGRKSSADLRRFKRSSSTPHGDSSTYLLSDLLSGFDKLDDGDDDGFPGLKSSSSAGEIKSKQQAAGSTGFIGLKSCSSARERMNQQAAGSTEFLGLKSCSSARERPNKQDAGSTEFRGLKSCSSAGEHGGGSADQFLALKSSSSARQVTSSKQQENSLRTDNPSGTKSSSSDRSRDQQIVVLRVSIHCKGCEGKVGKHISKMEGIDFFHYIFTKIYDKFIWI
ncbi:uncharacterized protein LOC110826259 [Carica papaya]|uniref:uncharacterized protein LOC110826259 n=1 Tax=Carica papaya TaxID=3649 RepID=UPI000B8C757D|nr:uncharacterized protein LOC110826259 [Carica papaya]